MILKQTKDERKMNTDKRHKKGIPVVKSVNYRRIVMSRQD